MKIISHRGNLNGSNPDYENKPKYIVKALSQGFDVEIDLWKCNGGLYLGHDEPKYKILFSFLADNKDWLWIHCKNVKAAELMFINTQLNAFFHQTDDISITSKGYLWTYPGKLITSKSIAVLPETVPNWDIKGAFGVCTDYPLNYK